MSLARKLSTPVGQLASIQLMNMFNGTRVLAIEGQKSDSGATQGRADDQPAAQRRCSRNMMAAWATGLPADRLKARSISSASACEQAK